MLPDFELVTSRSLRDCELQVIVKAQVYQVFEGGLYSVSVHTEGTQAEHICAVGLYYVDIDAELDGGELQLLRAIKGGCGNTYLRKQTVHVRAGQGVVFDNNAVFHQMLPLSHKAVSATAQAKGLKPAQRWVLAFSLVHPDSVIHSSATIQVNAHFPKEIEQKGSGCLSCLSPSPPIISLSPVDDAEALKRRNQLRELRQVMSSDYDPRLQERFAGQD